MGNLVKAVVFDVDDTLYEQLVPFEKAIHSTFKRVFENEFLLKLYLDFRFFSDDVFDLTINGQLSLEEMRIYRITEALKKNQLSCSKEQANSFQKNYASSQKEIVIQDEVLSVLKKLITMNVPLGILTNGPTNHQKAKIKQLAISDLIPNKYHFISGKLGLNKPNPDIFDHVSKMMTINPNELIYVGDSYENDVVGAKQANWTSLWINKYQKNITSEDIQPDREIKGYHQLKEVLLELIE